MATLTKPRIIDAALAVIDEHGLDGLTMRALADHLEVTATALYYHFAGRDELLQAIVERQTAKLVKKIDLNGDWRDQVRTLITGVVDELSQHPDLAVWIITTQARQASVLQVHESLLGILVDAGFAPRAAIHAKGHLFRFLIGHLVLANAPEGKPWKRLPRRYAHLRSTGPAHDMIDRDELFRDGLDTILRGLGSG